MESQIIQQSLRAIQPKSDKNLYTSLIVMGVLFSNCLMLFLLALVEQILSCNDFWWTLIIFSFIHCLYLCFGLNYFSYSWVLIKGSNILQFYLSHWHNKVSGTPFKYLTCLTWKKVCYLSQHVRQFRSWNWPMLVRDKSVFVSLHQ